MSSHCIPIVFERIYLELSPFVKSFVGLDILWESDRLKFSGPICHPKEIVRKRDLKSKSNTIKIQPKKIILSKLTSFQGG